MKLNEKTLSSYATCSLPPDLEGWLLKRGEVNKAFQKRWCVLRGNLLFYSEKPGDKEPLGVIILEGCTVELADEETEVFAFKLVFQTEGKAGRTYILGTSTQEDLEKWIRMLACASFDYMKLMVVEMQQKIAELEEKEKVQQASQIGDRRAEPLPPPRTRHNPFNASGGGGGSKPRHSWLDYHKMCGQQIMREREEWLSRRGSAAAASNRQQPPTGEVIQMTEENLLVLV